MLEVLNSEPSRVGVSQHEFPLQPPQDLLFGLAGASVPFFETFAIRTLFKLDDEVSDSGRVIVALDQDPLFVNTEELFVVVAQVIDRAGMRWVEKSAFFSLSTIGVDTQLLGCAL